MIKNGKVVNLAYSLTNAEGEVLDEADAKDPFTYLHGASQIIPGLETALEGLDQGAKKKVTIPPADAYGEVNPELKLTVNRSQFPADAQVAPGMAFEAHTPEGHGVLFRVEGVQGDKVMIDGNHPLAGVTLTFDVEVLDIRDATKEEMEHGHAHGEGEHHH